MASSGLGPAVVAPGAGTAARSFAVRILIRPQARNWQVDVQSMARVVRMNLGSRKKTTAQVDTIVIVIDDISVYMSYGSSYCGAYGDAVYDGGLHLPVQVPHVLQ